MTRREATLIRTALLPWLGAGLLWFGFVAPLRGDQESRLSRQARVRRERLSAEQNLRESQSLRDRITRALGSACRTTSDPASLRQRAVAATAGLALSPFSLSVTGGPGGGASVEAAGTLGAVGQLLGRLGDPARGGFLRSVTLRRRGGSWTMSASTGALTDFPSALLAVPALCANAPDPVPAETGSTATRKAARPRVAAPAGPAPPPPPPPSEISPALPPPITLVAFVAAGGKTRASISVRGEVRVVAPGDQVDEWTCLSIDRDQGVVFTSASGLRLVLKPRP
jgi:hypothetical protein